ncbi:hypothetical protein H2200_007965 [Cladophialophora chaetospira]|uniref:Glycosyltransferase 2-like domain-containing protein n=1 Tax=Cladophialophora chaetospira TaxID=386627 RepID=A0AA39CGK5_9EURO|nr:hypothetical protein H2200_007965 [Cladophialophora chaetospira]
MQNISHDSFELFGNTLPTPPRKAFARVSSSSDLSIRGSKTKAAVLGTYLYKKCDQQKWFEQDEDDFDLDGPTTRYLGVVLKSDDGSYTSEPQSLDSGIVAAVEHTQTSFAVTMRSGAVTALLEQTTNVNGEIFLNNSTPPLRLVNNAAQILKLRFDLRVEGLILVLCKKERVLLLCSEDPQDLLRRGGDVEDMIVSYLFGNPSKSRPQSRPASTDRSRDSEMDRLRNSRALSTQLLPYLSQSALKNESVVEKLNIIQTAVEKEELGDKLFDPEKEGQEAPKRKMLLNHAFIVGASIVLGVVVEMACIAQMIREMKLDGKMIRFALVATVPLFATFSLFFMIVICGSLWQIFGPLSTLKENSKYYSAVAPKPGRYPDLELPHITIQMPVYKEGLTAVIMPTISSVMTAVRYYEQQGGTASIFINDDGMQLINKDLADARKAYYELNNIGWCSRPAHKERKKAKRGAPQPEDDGTYFIRKGKFKKASNMNYCLDFSLRVEDEYLENIKRICQQRGCTEESIDPEEEFQIYEQARDSVIEKDNGRTWAAGDVRLGSVILIIDSDTRVPEESLLYGALEMHESPELALLQHASGILQVVNNVFEDGITYFTELTYNSILFAVGNGDCAPFVGHNTFIRWGALQSISWYDEEDKCTKFWSDSHVSEDFDVSLRLQMNDFIVRLAAYHDGGFKEGVSLTVYDELARWEKYAYGCNELVFNPLYKWPYKGPFTRLFLRFIFSKIKPTSKITIFAYIGTYYAVASAIPLSLANYLIVGWLDNDIDQASTPRNLSQVAQNLRVLVVPIQFLWADNSAVLLDVLEGIRGHGRGIQPPESLRLCYASTPHGEENLLPLTLGHRQMDPNVLALLRRDLIPLDESYSMPFFQPHCIAMVQANADTDMEWTTTAKEFNGGFRVGLDRIVRDFKWMYLVIALSVAGMIYLARFAPYGWTIKDFSAIVPLANQIGCHALLPFALGLF